MFSNKFDENEQGGAPHQQDGHRSSETEGRPVLPPLASQNHDEKRGWAWRTGAFVLWLAIAAMVVAGAGMAWYSYPTVQEHSAQLARLMGFEDSYQKMVQRLNFTEADLRALDKRMKSLRQGFQQLGDRLTARTKDNRKEIQTLLAETRKLRSEAARQRQAAEARLDKLEQNREANEARLVRLQDELARLERQLINARRQAAAARTEAALERSALRERTDQSAEQLAAVQSDLRQERADFEVRKSQTREVADGVYLTVTGADVRRRVFSGWIQLVPEGRTLWIREQSVQQPVVFHRLRENRRQELVITHLRSSGAVGYVLTGGPGSPEQVAASSGPDAQAARGSVREVAAVASRHGR